MHETRTPLLLTLLLLGGLASTLKGEDVTSYIDWSNDDQKWHGTVSGEYKAGDTRQISQVGLTLPLLQTETALLFTDFRGRTDQADNEEVNLGIAFRKIIEQDKILGLYGYFDRKTSFSGHEFDGATIGAELLTERWDLRVNGYLSETDPRIVGPAPGFGTLSYTGGIFYVNNQVLVERAYQGFDYEIGGRVAEFGDAGNELRIFGGGFFFDNDTPGYPQIAGPRGRVELRLFDLPVLGDGSRVTLSGEVQWDDVRDTTAFGGLAVQIPLGKTNGKGNPFGPSAGYSSLSRLERRMFDPIIRDVDIVTHVETEGNPAEELGPFLVESEGQLFALEESGQFAPVDDDTSGLMLEDGRLRYHSGGTLELAPQNGDRTGNLVSNGTLSVGSGSVPQTGTGLTVSSGHLGINTFSLGSLLLQPPNTDSPGIPPSTLEGNGGTTITLTNSPPPSSSGTFIISNPGIVTTPILPNGSTITPPTHNDSTLVFTRTGSLRLIQNPDSGTFRLQTLNYPEGIAFAGFQGNSLPAEAYRIDTSGRIILNDAYFSTIAP